MKSQLTGISLDIGAKRINFSISMSKDDGTYTASFSPSFIYKIYSKDSIPKLQYYTTLPKVGVKNNDVFEIQQQSIQTTTNPNGESESKVFPSGIYRYSENAWVLEDPATYYGNAIIIQVIDKFTEIKNNLNLSESETLDYSDIIKKLGNINYRIFS